MNQVQSPIQQFFGLDGQPLNGGKIFIGTAGASAEASPLPIFFDSAGTIPAAQPLRTLNGYMARNNGVAQVYLSEATYSITVRDINSSLVFSLPNVAAPLGTPSVLIAQNSGTSLGAVAQNLTFITLNDATAYHARAIVTGVKTDGTKRASYELIGTFYRTAAGAAAQQGTTTVVHAMTTDGTWVVDLTKVSNNVVVTVQGASGDTVHWNCKLELTPITEA